MNEQPMWEKLEEMARTLWRRREYESEFDAEQALVALVKKYFISKEELREKVGWTEKNKFYCKNPACGKESHPCGNSLRSTVLHDLLRTLGVEGEKK